MNKTKKYLRNLGVKFDCDYPWLPYDLGTATIEASYLKIIQNRVFLIACYTSLVSVRELLNDGEIRPVSDKEWDEINRSEYSDYEYEEDFDMEDDYYTPSATAGDYSPSCPWNAPGMSISDFI